MVVSVKKGAVRICVDDVEGCESEARPLLTGSHAVPALAEKHSMAVLTGLCVVYIFCIAPVALPGAIIPSLEDEAGWAWSPVTSGVYLGATTWAVAVGALAIGWLPDHFPNVLVILAYVFCAGLLLEAMSVVHTPAHFIMLHVAIFALKGVSWPAAMSILGTHLRSLRPELGILMVGLFSRLGGCGTQLFTGSMLRHGNWRHALGSMAASLITVAVVFRLLLNHPSMKALLQAPLPARRPRAVEAAAAPAAVPAAAPAEGGGEVASSASSANASSSWAFAKAWALALTFFKSRSFWILLLFQIGAELSWCLPVYMGAFAHTIYHKAASDSAILSSVVLTGDVLSILLGIFLILGGVRRRTIFVVILMQLCLGVLVSISFMVMAVPVGLFSALGVLFSFTMVLGGYLIVPLFCIEEAKREGVADIALRVTIVDGLSALVGASCKLLIGYERKILEPGGLLFAEMSALLGSGIMLSALAYLTWSNWETPVLAPDAEL